MSLVVDWSRNRQWIEGRVPRPGQPDARGPVTAPVVASPLLEVLRDILARFFRALVRWLT